MSLKKIFYKLTNKKKYQLYKSNIAQESRLRILKAGFENEINQIHYKLKKKEISFLHSGHLGDVINALPVLKELSRNHKCNLYLKINEPLESNAWSYKHEGDKIYMSEKMVKMVMPLLKKLHLIHSRHSYCFCAEMRGL